MDPGLRLAGGGVSVIVTITDEHGQHKRTFADEDLQRVLDWAHRKYGTPGEVLHIPDVLPEPKTQPPKRRGR